MCLAQGHNASTPVRLELTAPRSRVKHSTTEPLRSLCLCFKGYITILSSSDCHMIFCRLPIFLKFRNTIRVSHSLDPDQAKHLIGHDLDQNCLQRLSADDISEKLLQARKEFDFGKYGVN